MVSNIVDKLNICYLFKDLFNVHIYNIKGIALLSISSTSQKQLNQTLFTLSDGGPASRNVSWFYTTQVYPVSFFEHGYAKSSDSTAPLRIK